MIRLFKVYYPVRTLVLLAVEMLIVWLSFMLGTLVWIQQDRLLVLNNQLFIEGGFVKLLLVTGIVLMLSHGLDLYDSNNMGAKWDQVFRLLMVLGLVALMLSGVDFVYPRFLPGRTFLPRYAALSGLIILTFLLLGWRTVYAWLVQQPYLRERVYVLGNGERAERLLKGLRQRSYLVIEVVGWTGNLDGAVTR